MHDGAARLNLSAHTGPMASLTETQTLAASAAQPCDGPSAEEKERLLSGAKAAALACTLSVKLVCLVDALNTFEQAYQKRSCDSLATCILRNHVVLLYSVSFVGDEFGSLKQHDHCPCYFSWQRLSVVWQLQSAVICPSLCAGIG